MFPLELMRWNVREYVNYKLKGGELDSMTVFAVDIEKHRAGHEEVPWTNQYHIQETTLDHAVVGGLKIVVAEQAIHSTTVHFDRYRVSTVLEDDAVFTTLPLNLDGLVVEGGDPLPAFLAFRLDFTPSFGRNGRKFFHTCWGESAQANGIWTSEYVDVVIDAWAAFFADITSPTLCNKTGGKIYPSTIPYTTVTQHQFRRGSKRRVPIIP